MHLASLLALLLALALATPAPAAARATKASKKKSVTAAVPLTTAFEPVAGRKDWPISTGVPFPRGMVAAGTALAARDLRSPRILQATQSRVLSRWSDGSVRWALVDWQVDASAPPGRWELVAATKSLPPLRQVVRARPGTNGITVDTGPLQFTIPQDHFALFEDVRWQRQPVLAGPVGASISGEGQTWTPQPPKSLQVLENGPLRVRIESRGTYNDHFDYVVRIDAFAGQSWIRVLHTFEQRSLRDYLPVSRISLEYPLPQSKGDRFLAGIDGKPPLEGKVDGGVWRFVQLDNGTMSVQGGERPGRSSGWLDVTGEQSGITIAVPYLWQEYPQGFTVTGGKLSHDLLSANARPLPIGMGAAKTHEIVIAFHGPDRPAAEWIEGLMRSPVATSSAEWIDSSRALRNSIVRNPQTNNFVGSVADAFHRVQLRNARERWDDTGQVRCIGDETPREGAFGMLNWGDWNYPGYHDDTKGCDAWGNQEYDLSQAYALGYAVTGEPAMREAMVVAARHFMDVDIVHFQTQRSDFIGMNHPKNPLHFATELGGVDLGHTWTEGLLSTYLLTGDERSLAAARGIGDYLVQRTTRGVVKGNPRQFGWPQIALIALFETTGEAKYRDAAAWYAERGMAAHKADLIDNWKLGILAEGLAYTHSATANGAILAWLKSYTAAAEPRARDPRFFPAIAYVGKLESNEAATKAALRAAGRLQFGSWAKPFTIAARLGFAIYSTAR